MRWNLLALALAGWQGQAAATAIPMREAAKFSDKMSCTIDGAATFSASGAQVRITRLGAVEGPAVLSFGLGMTAASNGQTHEIDTGAIELPAKEGHYQFPRPGQDGAWSSVYRIRNGANAVVEDYTGKAWWQFYGVAAQGAQARLMLDIDRLNELELGRRYGRPLRFNMSGQFRFNAAWAAGVDGKLAQACRAATPWSIPAAAPAVDARRDPAACGVRQHLVECAFEVYLELPYRR
ncbi:hypothetical protein [Massilia aquatica]|uniref:Uncharacterized protein n=1 Tax=Massilia aquatica TaxID=2609000 RepID=A0ABX0MDL8_9BURK|nr:hypothetical protein [Massilia aquatica]NHZ42076.1 hypothetical protein [Massilia aquatica]